VGISLVAYEWEYSIRLMDRQNGLYRLERGFSGTLFEQFRITGFTGKGGGSR
jgi:hypothetical protein